MGSRIPGQLVTNASMYYVLCRLFMAMPLLKFKYQKHNAKTHALCKTRNSTCYARPISSARTSRSILALRARSSRLVNALRARPSCSELETCTLASVSGRAHRIMVGKNLSSIVVRILLKIFQLYLALCYPYYPNDNLAKYCCIRTLSWSKPVALAWHGHGSIYLRTKF